MNKLLEKFPNIKTDYNLADLTTFKIGGPAKYFLEISNLKELQEVVKFCKQSSIDFKIIGGGSNLLVNDNGFDGLIIKLNNKNIELLDDGIFKVDAGVVLLNFVNFSLEKGFTGQEFLAGIPGTVGGAIYGNAGAYGQDMGSIVIQVQVLNQNNEFVWIEKKDCVFEYRQSIFKDSQHIILQAQISLTQENIQVSQELIQQRILQRAQGHPLNMPNAGSWFKNIDLTNELKVRIEKLANSEEMRRFEKYQKIPAAFLIEQAGLKGYQIGGAQMSEKHANFLINAGQATAEDIINLSDYVKEKIKDKYGIELEEEVQYIGF